jgi:Flp pilus assembly protein TadB
VEKPDKYLKKLGVILVDRFGLDQPGRGKLELQQDLMSLSMGKRASFRRYYIRKLTIVFMILLVGMLLSVGSLVLYFLQKQEDRLQVLERPGYGEGDRKEELTVQIEGEEKKEQLEITVQERKYTDDEKQQLLDQALEQLKEVVAGDNASLDEVRSDLVLPDVLCDGAVTVSWVTMPYGVIGPEGELQNVENEEGTLVQVDGTLSCAEAEATYTFYANVFPPILSEQEELQHQIQKEVAQADARDSSLEQLELPEQVAGRNVTWTKPVTNPFPALLALTLVAALAVYLEMDSRIHQKAEERRNQLMLDYPDLMWKMTMLLGAGLSIRGTFSRISEEYLREKKAASVRTGRRKSFRIRYVYEEVTYACYEMQSGISEAQAYERFGRRCQLPEYIRLGSVLSQNLKKGARGLTDLLETEAEASLNERKNHARKIGEQAGTKLLLPMILMLGIVLVILMVPAFLSF